MPAAADRSPSTVAPATTKRRPGSDPVVTLHFPHEPAPVRITHPAGRAPFPLQAQTDRMSLGHAGSSIDAESERADRMTLSGPSGLAAIRRIQG